MQNYCHDKVEVEVMIEGEIKREVELGSGSGKSLHISRIIFKDHFHTCHLSLPLCQILVLESSSLDQADREVFH